RLAAIGRVILHANPAAFYWLAGLDRRRSSNVRPEIPAEQILDFVEAHGMVLSAARCDLDRAHQRSEPSGFRPVETRGKTVKKAGPIGITATGGIDHFRCLNAGNLEPLAVGVDDRDRKSTRLNSSHVEISYAVFCLKKKRYSS